MKNVIVVRKGQKPVGYTVVYIGRPSMFGNPYAMRSESERDEVIAKHRVWLNEMRKAGTRQWSAVAALAARVKAGEKLALECYCAPRKCHGDTIAAAIAMINGE